LRSPHTSVESCMSTPITITPVTVRELPAVVALMQAQQTRLHVADARLPHVRSYEACMAQLLRHLHDPSEAPPLVAYTEEGRVRGYVVPWCWTLPDVSTLHAFLSPRNGMAGCLTLPDPLEEDAQAVTHALLDVLSETWRTLATTGDVIRWPASETWVEQVLSSQWFRLDSVCALAPPFPVSPTRQPLRGISIRAAREQDAEALLSLWYEELVFHEHCLRLPFVHALPQALAAFPPRIAQCWSNRPLENDTPLVLVAEQHGHTGGQIVGMVVCSLLEVEEPEPGFTPPGRYLWIESICVQPERRGQGIGRALVQKVAACAPYPIDGVLLWYHPENRLAAHFWALHGVVPIFTTYQRWHSEHGTC
jgi:GNAT superfamily N-acetyltransferase